MIYLYEGTPGSGKSFHVCSRIFDILSHDSANIIANFPIDVESIYLTRLGVIKAWIQDHTRIRFSHLNYKPVTGHFLYIENSEMTVDRLMDICHRYHRYKISRINGSEQKIYIEGQTLVLIDESQILFNCRDFGDKGRKEWCSFFTQHRKYGFNIILVAPYERMLDRQIRYLIEVYVMHRNCKYWKTFAKILAALCGGSLFVSMYRWQGCNDVMKRELRRYNPRIASIYNSYLIFNARQ